MNQEKNKTRNLIILSVCMVLYLVISLFQGPLRTEFTAKYVGVLTSIHVLIATLIVITNYKRGFIVSLVLCSISILSALTATLQAHSVNSLPGVILPIITIITTTSIFTYMQLSHAQANQLSEQYQKIVDSHKIILEKDNALRMLAYEDRLTGMKNIQYFTEQLEEAIKVQPKFTIIYIDIDNFKSINDTFGPKTGDSALVSYANRIAKFCHDKYVCARTAGGDEFVILLLGEQTETNIIGMIEEIRELFNEKIAVQGTKFSVTASYGIATSPRDGATPEMLLDSAILAVYKAKAKGKDRTCFFSQV